MDYLLARQSSDQNPRCFDVHGCALFGSKSLISTHTRKEQALYRRDVESKFPEIFESPEIVLRFVEPGRLWRKATSPVSIGKGLLPGVYYQTIFTFTVCCYSLGREDSP
jgi:hypothetical protein